MKLPVMEHFYTVQGEGYHSGRAAYFIRLGGCDVGCHWCDVKESWDADVHPKYEIAQMVDWVVTANADFCVITGGEPAMYNLTELSSALKEAGIEVAIETSGAHELIGDIDWVCFSPKKFKKPEASIYNKADELKVIIYNKSDFAWGETFANEMSINCKLYLQPEWDKSDEMMPSIIEYVKENPKWKISLQTHKFLNIP